MTLRCAGKNRAVHSAEVVSYDWQSRPFSFVCWDDGTNLLRDPRRNEGPHKHQCLKDIFKHSLRLHILAPLPTATPESAGLYALYLVYIVYGSLATQRPGLATRPGISTTTLQFVAAVCDDDMVAVRGRPSGLPGLIPLGSLTRAQLPPLLV